MIGESAERRTTERLHAALDGRLDGYLRTDPASRALWSTDASIYQRRPVAVAIVRSEEDVRRALAAARDLGLSVTPRGTGTSLAGQATAPGLALDLSEMQQVLEMDPDERRCSVEPGVIQAELNALVQPHGLVFGADTSTSNVATLGGMVGTNSAGMRSIYYGTTADQILSLRCVLASGEIVELKPLPRDEAERRARGVGSEARLLKNALEVGERYGDEIRRRYPALIRRVSGYDLEALIGPDTVALTRLVCGSEGTLAVVTRAEFRLRDLPPAKALASLEFDSLAASARATVALLEERPSAVELLDDVAIEGARYAPAYRDATRFVQGEPKALLLVEWRGAEEELDERFSKLEDLAEEVGASAVVPLRTKEEMEQTAHLREAILPLLMGRNEKAKPIGFVEDAAVPPEQLEEFVVRFEEIIEKYGTWGCFYGHASVGTLHVRPALDTWDPEGMLNPGVIVDPAPMDKQLRIGPDHRRLPTRTNLDFSDQGGFAEATERCFGAGFCRKKNTGTMCPSYMVTLDEEDTTRARANMLRSILDGTLPPEELTGKRMREVMDLCVGCKACKSECPAQVDVASLKIEVLSQIGQKHGFKVSQKIAGHVRRGLALAALAPSLFNAVGSTY